MANAEHLEILKAGVEVWNKWRKKNPDIRIDLSEADLKGLNLSGVNFFRTSLFKATLLGSILTNADMSEADLYDAILTNADLSGAFLHETNFNEAVLYKANLSEAEIYRGSFISSIIDGVNFSEAELREVVFFNNGFDEANFTKCQLTEVIFASSDLSYAIGLETVIVGEQCSIDFQTLRDSKNIPNIFLKKIGLPENYINYLPDFYDENPIRLHPAFLSHSWADKPFATKLYEALIQRNVLVWFDERKLLPGDDMREGITKGIDLYDKFILVCSKNSLKESWWVDKELNRALDKEQRLFKEKGRQINTIIPITIDDYVFKEWDGAKRPDIHRYLIGDFKDWQDDAKFEKALDVLVAALNADRGEDKVPGYL